MTLKDKIKNLVHYDLIAKLKDILSDLDNKVVEIEEVISLPPSGGSSVIVKTKTEIDALISSNSLVEGATYKITGVHPALYNDGTNSGTTIYLQALTPNALAKEGYGEFWNPKYNQDVIGFGVWSNFSTYNATVSTGTFVSNELITANNGATGKLAGNISSRTFIAFTGNWAAATSITGNTSGATATINSVVVKSYAIGSKAIWGGYSWTNTTGLVGNSNSIVALDSNWSKDLYTSSDYNHVFDVIDYDYSNDWIERRYELKGSNEVIYTKFNDDWLSIGNSAISVFMWGNAATPESYKGTGSCKIINSYFESVDFRGELLQSNTVTELSVIKNNIMLDGSYFTENNLESSSVISGNYLYASNFQKNNLHNSSIKNNELDFNSTLENNVLEMDSRIESNIIGTNKYLHNNRISKGEILSNKLYTGHIVGNVLFGGYVRINSNILNGTGSQGGIQENTLSSNSYISNNTITNNPSNFSSIMHNNLSQSGSIDGNVMNYGSIMENNLQNGSSIGNNNFTNNGQITRCTLNMNSVIAMGQGNPLNAKAIQFAIMDKTLILIGVGANTHLNAGYVKNVYTRPDGTVKLRYIDNSDAVVVANITD